MKTRALVPRTSLALLALAAVGVAVWSLRYALPHVPAPSPLTNFVVRRTTLCVHAVTASVALLVGPWQFWATSRRGALHRWVGRTYAAMVLVGGVTAVLLALPAQTGVVASGGFFVLGIVWLVTTAIAVQTILQRDVAAHRRWMIRSYGLTTAAITLRIYLPLAIALKLPMPVAYPAIAWLCWVPNAIAAELLVARTRRRTEP